MEKYMYIVAKGWCGYDIELSDIILTTDSLSVAINECMSVDKNIRNSAETRSLFVLKCGSSVVYSCDLYRGNAINVMKSLDGFPSEITRLMGNILAQFIEEEKLEMEEKENNKRLSKEVKEKKLLAELKAKYE